MRRSTEIASGLALILIGVVYLVTSSRYSWGQRANPGPGFFPSVVGVAFLIGSAALCILSILSDKIRHANTASEQTSAQDTGAKKLWLLLALLAVYLLTLDRLGYLIGSPLLVLISARLMGLKSWMQALLLAIGATLGTYVVFGIWFQMTLPRGTFFMWGG